MLIRIDHKLRIALSELPSDVLHLIEDALLIPNIQRQKAMEQNIWGWQELPEFVKLWEISPMMKHLVLPRGFLVTLLSGLDSLNIPWMIEDNRFFDDVPTPMGNEIALKRWQWPALDAIATHAQGIWKAPAGSGKTVGILEAIRLTKTPSIVLVNTKDILYQWKARARTFLGEDFPVSLIGDGKMQVSDYLTIAMVQTLHSRFDELESNGFFDDFGFMCLDECHHATAETYRKIVDRFSSRIRVGVSATPDKTGDFELAKMVLGPIIHETRREDVDSIIKPDVFKIMTDFQFGYRGTKGRLRNNYAELLDKLVTDRHRNLLIVKSILANPGSHSLVVTKRIEHIFILSNMLLDHQHGDHIPIYRLTGQQTTAERNFVISEATVKPSVIFSTVADEALDIPRLDSLFLVFPQRNPGLVEQQVGRICREHPAKKTVSVFDFVDNNVGPLNAQWMSRRKNVYEANDYDIHVVTAKQIMEY